MKITHFSTINLHGYLTFSLAFNPDLTFLTGINGSGKTSAIRAITALLTPSLAGLTDIKYKKISVAVEHEGSTEVITSLQTEDDVWISLAGGSPPEELKVPIFRSEAYEGVSNFNERRREYYRDQEAIQNRHPVLEYIRNLPTPMFLDLERRYQEGTRIKRLPGRFVTRTAGPVNPLAGTLADSLAYAQQLAEDAYSEFQFKRTLITDKLKLDLILSPFSTANEEEDQPFWGSQQAFIENLNHTQRMVMNSLPAIGMAAEQMSEKVAPFFERVRSAAQQLPDEAQFESGRLTTEQINKLQEWSAIQPKIKQIGSIVARITTYNQQVARQYESLRQYLASVNDFLSDSAKKLGFDARGRLNVSVEGDKKPRDINALSSGERQIVVILTHLAFNKQAKRANILIIDEPELSLHLRWQELFVDAVISASPGLQVILATHSPSVIKGRTWNCIDVREEWKNAGLFA